MIQREEENFGAATPPLRSIKGVGIQNVGALTIGECFIRNIKFYSPRGTDTPVTAVAVGATFDFTVDWKCTNSQGTATDTWSLCIVWWNGSSPAASTIKGFYKTDTLSNIGALTHPTYLADNLSRIAGNYTYVMPNANVILKFNMFINDDTTPAAVPPESDWMLLK